jgi:hypothetical protein
VDLYAVADRMADKGWHIDRQHRPPTIHLTVTTQHVDHAEAYVRDLRDAVEHVRAHPELRASGQAAMYGMMAKVPFPWMVRRSVTKVLEAMHAPAGQTTDPLEAATGGGPLDRFLQRHQDAVLRALDRVEAVRRALPWSGR